MSAGGQVPDRPDGKARPAWPGLSLTAKLVGILLALVAAAVGVSTWSSLRTIDGLARSEVEARRRSGEEAIRREAELVARNAAAAVALPLVDGSFTYLDTLVEKTLKEDARVRFLVVADEVTGRIVARAGQAPQGEALDPASRAQVAEAPADRILSWRDAKDPTLWTYGARSMAGERLVGQVRLGVSTAALEADLTASIQAAKDRSKTSARRVLLWGALILLGGLLLGVLQGVRMTRPLRDLTVQAQRIAGGDLEHRVHVGSRDELGTLASNFNDMAERLRYLLAETATKASLEREMSLARGVQESMIPPPVIVSHASCRVIGHCRPATTCGGDWWAVRPLGPDRVLVAVGDVTGHGMPSAMVAATARGAVEALVREVERNLTPATVLRAIDACLRGLAAEHRLLMTCFVAITDSRRGVIDYANAGHNFPYVLQSSAQGRVKPSVLNARGGLLGDETTELQFEVGMRRLVPGDVLVCFSDGLVERADPVGNRFGDRRLLRVFTSRSQPADGPALASLCEHVLQTVDEFSNGLPAEDDVTLVLCHYDPPAREEALPRAAGV